MDKKRSLYNILVSVIGQLISLVITIVVPRFFILNYGAEVHGFTNSISQIYVYLALLEAGIGVATIQALYKAVADRDKKSISSILAATDRYYKKVSLLYFIAIIVFATLYVFTVKSDIAPWEIVGVIFFSGISSVVNFLYQGKYSLLMVAEGRNYVSTGFYTISNILSAAGKLVCILLKTNLVTIFVVFALLSLSQVLFFGIYIRKKYKWIDLSVRPDYEAISQKNWVLVHQVAALIFSNAHVIILTFVLGLKFVSVYAVYKLVTSVLSALLYNVGVSTYYILGQTYNKDKSQYLRLIDTYDTYKTGFGFALFTIACILLLPFVTLYTQGASGVQYVYAAYPLLFVIPELLNLCRDAMSNTINFAKHFKQTAPRAIAEMIINIGLSFVLVFRMGIPGLLIASMAALLYRTNDIIIYANKRILGRSPLRSYRIYLSNFLLFGLILFVMRYIPLNISNYLDFTKWGLILSMIIIPAYMLMSCLVNPKEFKYLSAFLKPGLKKLLSRKTAAQQTDHTVE